MTADEFQDALARLGASPAAIARLLGVDARTARRWSAGAKPIPDSVAAQIDALLQDGALTPERIAAMTAARSGPAPERDTSRFLWVRRKDDDRHWTVAEHDLISDIFYLPGRVERFDADELVLGPDLVAPPL